MYTTKVKVKSTGKTGVLKYSEEASIKENNSSLVYVRLDGDSEDHTFSASNLELVEHEAISHLKAIIRISKSRGYYVPGGSYDNAKYQEAIEILEEHFKNKQ